MIAVTLELWRSPENDGERSCCSASAVRLARSVAHAAGIPHLTVDLREAFRAGVVEPYLEGHRQGRTPNPCVACNGQVRIDAMIALADRLGAATLVTGHYARVDEPTGLLRAAVDPAKDQTYMLAGLAPESLARLRFPLGELTKPQVRDIAEAAGISVAKRPESQDLCFLAGTARRRSSSDTAAWAISRAIVTTSGEVVGEHQGAHRFTVGQRRGLDLGGGPIRYVLATDPQAGTVTVGEHDELLTTEIRLGAVRLHQPQEQVDAVRLRYHSAALPATLSGDTVHLTTPFAGAAPGQVACLLRGDLVVGRA